MSRRQQLIRTVAGLLGGVVVANLGLLALHLWLAEPPVVNEGTLFDGIRHGALAPVGGVRTLMGQGVVKDFASGWLYELGFYSSAAVLLCLWQTVLQIRTYRAMGRRHSVEQPLLISCLVMWLLLVGLGLVFGDPVPTPSAVPALFGVVPGWIRHGAMALLAVVVPITGGWAGAQLAIGQASQR